MGFSIRLTPQFQAVYWQTDDGFRIRIDADRACGLPAEVFCYLEMPLSPGQSEPDSEFSHVASSTDLEEFPADAPDRDALPPYYRRAHVDLVFRSRSQALDCYEVIVEDVRNLLRSLEHEAVLVALEPIVIEAGDGCEEGSSSSSLMSP